MRLRLFLYKLLTLVWFLVLIAAMFFATDGAYTWALVAFLSALVLIGIQALLVRCPYCHTRPGLWILAIWTLLPDFELYIADVLLLRKCPHCDGLLVVQKTVDVS